MSAAFKKSAPARPRTSKLAPARSDTSPSLGPSLELDEPPTLDASVVVPVRDEAAWIDRCLTSIRSQDLGGRSIEILVVDGGSTDATRSEVARHIAADPRVRWLDNPAGRVSPGLNTGIRAARGRVLVRMDAHSLYEPDYIAASLALLESSGCAAVGGVQVPSPANDGAVARAIAAAQGSRFGTGGGLHRRAGYEGPAESLWLGAFHRELVERIGGFDETLFRSEDNDFYQRARAAGGSLLVSHRIRARYVCRPTFGAWARQCFVTGTEILPTILRNPRALSVRHLAPGVALATGAALTVAALLIRGSMGMALGLLLCAGAGLYAAIVIAGAIAANRGAGGGLFVPLLAAFPLSHLSYAMGTIVGAGKALRGAVGGTPSPE